MTDFWTYLIAPENRETWTWLGGGLATLCGGLWVVLRFFLSRPAANAPARQTRSSGSSHVTASRGGVAGGGDVNIGNRTGLPTGQVVLLVLALLGVLLIAISQVGNTVTVNRGIGIGGDVSGSTISPGSE